jgi:methylthioribulose-1-phosphate dehydratase
MRAVTKYKADASFLPLSLFERVALKNLCEVAKRLDSRIAIPATSSNFSLRCGPQRFFISKSGVHKRNLTPVSFLRVQLDGKAVHPLAPKPSDETLLHAVLYRLFENVNCILHCHAPEIEFLRFPSARLEGHELLKALGAPGHEEPLDLTVFRNNQNMVTLSEEVEARFHQELASSQSLAKGIFVLERHGIYCGGKDVQQAEARLEALLHLLETQ